MLGKGIRRSLTRKLNSCVPRPVVRLWYDPKAGASRLRGPLWVLLQTVDRCNGACTACPSKATTGGAPNLMDEGLYLRILDELLEAGVDEVHVSIDAVCETTFRKVRSGLDYATVAENTRALLDRSKAGQVTVRFLKQRANEGEEREFTKYWRARGAHVSLYEIANRAGTVREFERLSRNSDRLVSKGRRRGLKRAFAPVCTTPFLRLSVLWDGRVAACCEDWLNRVIVGDLSSQSLSAVWHGEPMNRHRRLLWAGQYDESASCRDCSIRFGVGQH